MYHKRYKTAQEFYQPTKTHTSNIIKETFSQNVAKPVHTPQHEQQLNLRWDTVKYASSANPEVWGPAFWFTLHNGAIRYPIHASPITKERMKQYIAGMPVMIPCETCKEHATAHIENNYNNLDQICSGRQSLFNFFVDFHNKVNKRYGKPEMSYEDAYKLYSDGAHVSKLTYSAS